jgi:hypothetical protein
MRSKPSPLLVWKWILIVVLGAGAFMFFSNPMKIVLAQRDERLIKKLSKNQFKKDEIGVIFYGDSLMNAVLPYREAALNTALSEHFTTNISAVKITTGGIWNLEELSDELIEAHPSIIVIQSEMVVRRNLKNKPRPSLTERIGTWSGALGLKLFGRSQKTREAPKQFFTVERKPVKIKRRAGKNKESLDVARLIWTNKAVSTTDPVFLMARKFIHRASAAGIRIVIVELPVSTTSADFSSKEYFAKRTAALQSLSKWGSVTFAYPNILPDRYFVDYNHVNPRGRREFLKWFLPVFAQEMTKYDKWR